MTTRDEALAAAESIAARRIAADRQQGWLPETHDFHAMLEYITMYQGGPAMALADRMDGLVIAMYLKTRAEAWQFAMMHGARALGVRWRDLAGPLGLASAQGAQQAYQRLEQASKGQPRSEVLARAGAAHGRALVALGASVDLRGVVADLADPGLGLPDSIAEDVGFLAERLASVAVGEPMPASVAASLRLVVRDMAEEEGLTDRAYEVMARVMGLLGMKPALPEADT